MISPPERRKDFSCVKGRGYKGLSSVFLRHCSCLSLYPRFFSLFSLLVPRALPRCRNFQRQYGFTAPTRRTGPIPRLVVQVYFEAGFPKARRLSSLLWLFLAASLPSRLPLALPRRRRRMRSSKSPLKQAGRLSSLPLVGYGSRKVANLPPRQARNTIKAASGPPPLPTGAFLRHKNRRSPSMTAGLYVDARTYARPLKSKRHRPYIDTRFAPLPPLRRYACPTQELRRATTPALRRPKNRLSPPQRRTPRPQSRLSLNDGHR